MTDYSPSEIVDMIIEYGRANENYRQCARQYTLFKSSMSQSYYNNEIYK